MKKNSKAFTLVELMVVIAIISILAGVVLVSASSYAKRARETAALQTASSVMPAATKCLLEGKSIGDTYTTAPVVGNPICAGSSFTWPTLSTPSTSGWAWWISYGPSNDPSNYFYYLLNDTKSRYIFCAVSSSKWINLGPDSLTVLPGACGIGSGS